MKSDKNIVAAELLSVKDKVSLLDAIAFPVAGDHLAGLAGALVGASLVPSKLIYTYRVLYDDGTQGKLKLDGTDPRVNWLMELPYLPDYEAYMEGKNAMENQSFGNQSQSTGTTPNGSPYPEANQQAVAGQALASNSGAMIGAGYYEFGVNFPVGVFNLEYVSGEGMLLLKGTDDWLTDISFGEPGGATSYYGLNSSEFKSFKLDGSVQLKATRAGMIQL